MHKKVRVGITIGDINGVGSEIIIKTFSESKMIDLCTPIVYGNAKVLNFYKKTLSVPDISFNVITDADASNHKRVNVINAWEEDVKIEMGESTVNAGKCAFNALTRAIEDLKAGKIDVLVTCPINKDNVMSAGFKFPGHTEFLQNKFEASSSLMLMICENLKIGVVTGHLPLSEVSKHITEESITEKIELLENSLKKDFRIRKPKIAVLGLNPHAGDSGRLGDEEQKVIIPAIEKLSAKGMVVFGPYSADAFFGKEIYKEFDAVMAMYHDQGLIPFKTIAMGEGVNFTAGLPIIRTSPAHGTAYDIAGKNEASEQSFRDSIYFAMDLFERRNEFDDLNSNPLKFGKFTREKGTV